MLGKLIDSIIIVTVLFGAVAVPSNHHAQRLPVLLYHHVSDEEASATNISAERFELHVIALLAAGYSFVTYDEVIDFVHNGGTLPSKAVSIDFDDGYLSNYTEVFPILKKYNIKANFFIIGSLMGIDKYKDMDYDIIPHFSYEQALEMIESGHVFIGSHTYDMHQLGIYEDGPNPQVNAVEFDEETDEEYEERLTNDVRIMRRDFLSELNRENFIMSYPGGVYSYKSERVLRSLGMKATLGTEADTNLLVQGDPECLFRMNRFTVGGDTSLAEVLKFVM